MARTLTITIPGAPMGKPRMTRSDKWNKRPCVLKYRAWADLARRCVKEQIGSLPPAETILSLSWVAYFAPPVTWSAKRKTAALGTLHRNKPDRDNIDKSLLDSLFDNDSPIACGAMKKLWGVPERLAVTIELEPTEQDLIAAKLKHGCPSCGAMTDGHIHRTPAGTQCDMILTRRGGWRQLGVYDG